MAELIQFSELLESVPVVHPVPNYLLVSDEIGIRSFSFIKRTVGHLHSHLLQIIFLQPALSRVSHLERTADRY